MARKKVRLIFGRYALAGLSGILMIVIFPGTNLSSLAWIALVPLLVSVHETNWKQSLWLGLITGFIYFGGIMNWLIVALHPFSTWFWVTLGFIALSLYLSTYVFIFTVSISFITQYWKHSPTARCLAYSFQVAIVWTGMEILRGHVITGLPWAVLAHTQWWNLPLIQISSLVGMYGVTFLIAMINGAIANFFIDISKWRASLKAATIPLMLLILCLVYGWMTTGESSQDEKIKIALVPGNIRQVEKLDAWRRGDADPIFHKYVRATEAAAAKEPDMIVWPETCIPQYTLLSNTAASRLKLFVKHWKTYLLMGTPHTEYSPERKIYNAAFLLSPDGKEVDKYYKMHLVPVSEYFPMKRYLPESWQELITGVSDWDSGHEPTIFSMSPAKFGLVICFESVFPGIFRKAVDKGVNLMGIITNDAWFEGTYAALQHFSMAPFRAVENRVSVFRCANYGVSCIIDPWGRIIQRLEPKDEEKYIVNDISLHEGGTFYTRHGDYLPWACLVAAIFLVFQTWRYARHRQ